MDGRSQHWLTSSQWHPRGNKELRELLRDKGNDYANNFQFSLIEVCDINADNDYIISRESHWKDVLLTREFGLNWN